MIVIKIALLGDGAVGKTALRHRFIGEDFQSSYLMTIGADFSIYEVDIDGKRVKFQIWDLAGQQRFAAVREGYYNGVMGCVVVYDVTRMETYTNIPHWINEIAKHSGHGEVPLVLLGNKTDLRDDFPDALASEQGQGLAKGINSYLEKKGASCKYFDTSAITGQNVREAFIELGKAVLDSITE
ncbi:MAG: GTP-binding protein [Candidatus Hodarchaeales archaeon]|jgi:small GTP-binding protein